MRETDGGFITATTSPSTPRDNAPISRACRVRASENGELRDGPRNVPRRNARRSTTMHAPTKRDGLAVAGWSDASRRSAAKMGAQRVRIPGREFRGTTPCKGAVSEFRGTTPCKGAASRFRGTTPCKGAASRFRGTTHAKGLPQNSEEQPHAKGSRGRPAASGVRAAPGRNVSAMRNLEPRAAWDRAPFLWPGTGVGLAGNHPKSFNYGEEM